MFDTTKKITYFDLFYNMLKKNDIAVSYLYINCILLIKKKKIEV